jgi:hypothetical protein
MFQLGATGIEEEEDVEREDELHLESFKQPN